MLTGVIFHPVDPTAAVSVGVGRKTKRMDDHSFFNMSRRNFPEFFCAETVNRRFAVII